MGVIVVIHNTTDGIRYYLPTYNTSDMGIVRGKGKLTTLLRIRHQTPLLTVPSQDREQHGES
jgi:hypothetical protein